VSTVEGLKTRPFDPLLHDIDLPLMARYHPVGFPLDIATNSRDVLEAAAESWGHYSPEFQCQPLALRIVVQPEGDLAPEPSFRSQGHYFSIISDRDNFASYDSKRMCGYCFVSAKTAADHTWFRYYFLETMVYMLLAQRYVVPLHAACVARNGSGVLLCGFSGAGKSTLAYACARAGWTYVADDSTLLLPDADDRMAIGRPHLVRLRDDASRLFPELAGYVPRPRPNGKLSIEVPLSAFPEIQTADHCRIGCVVFLERKSGGATRAEALPQGEVVETLLRDMPSYGEEVRAMVGRTVRRLRLVPAYRMQYDALDDAVELLSKLSHTTEQS
jgi:hypothetical protein